MSQKPSEGSKQRRDPIYVCKRQSGPIVSVSVSVAPEWRKDLKERGWMQGEQTGDR